jgi:putative DNA primase/helicase
MIIDFERQVKTADSMTGKYVLEIKDFCALNLQSRAAYLSPFIKEGSIGMISGWRGCGKTWFALGVLDAVSRGATLGPWKCENPVPCLLLDGEMPTADIIERSRSMGLDVDRIEPFYIYSDAYAMQQGSSRANLTDQVWRDDMKGILTDKGVKLWVIDNLASLAPGIDENSRQDWDPINQWLLELRFAGISTIMLHHLNKFGAQRGTSAREDNLDYSIVLNAPFNYTPEDGCRFIVNFSKARVRTAELSKIADSEFKLIQDRSGQSVWTYGNVQAETKNQILRLLDEGLSQTEIHTSLNVNKGYISRVRKQGIKDGLITVQNKLTQSGFQVVNANQN